MDCFENKKLAQEIFLKPYPLIDITVIPDDELRQHEGLAILELVQKNIHQRDTLEFVKDIALQVARQFLTHEQFNSLLYYISHEGESRDFRAFYASLSEALPNYREDIMTLAQQLKQQGLEQGLKEGEQRKAVAIASIAKKLLAEGRSPGAVKKLTGLSEKEVMALLDKH